MSENLAQKLQTSPDGRRFIENDWYPDSLPANLVMEDMVYPDTAYSFGSFHSREKEALKIGYASGNYGHSHFITGSNGAIKVGKYVILESTTIICNRSVTIGDHCMFSWGSLITDSWLDNRTLPAHVRKNILVDVAHSELRYLEYPATNAVVVEDNVWIGFDAVILPGVRLGRGCIVGCKTIIAQDVPPYAVVVGDPARVVKVLDADDTEEARLRAFNEYKLSSGNATDS